MCLLPATIVTIENQWVPSKLNKIRMKNTISIAFSLLVAAPLATAGTMIPDDGTSVAVASEQSFGRKLLSTPGRVLNVGDDLPPMLSEGTQEFGISGNFNFADDVAYNLNLSYGWFMQDGWEVGFQAGIQGIESNKNFSLGLFTEYNWATEDSKWVPFVGFSASWATIDRALLDADSIALGLDIGVKYFIRENIALSFSIGADFAFDDVFPGGDDFQEQINIGTRFYF
jgi:hypothetical protein